MNFGGRARGLSLGTVLIVTVLIATLGLALAGTSVTHLRLGQRVSHETRALNLARSVVAAGAESVFSDESYGESRSTGDSLDITLQGTDAAAKGRLCFNETQAMQWGIPYSTNNLADTGSMIAAESQVLPGRSVHLVGVGESGGVVRRVDAIFQERQYAYALASAAPVESQGHLTIGTVGADGSLAVEDLLPADLVSNSNLGTTVQLGANTLVTGDVQTPGLIQIQTPGTVKGELREGASPVELPQIEITDYDPEAQGSDFEDLAQASYSSTSFEGAVRSGGPLTINGDLTLDGCLLYVEGDLHITGGVQGIGIIGSSGSITVEKAASLSSANGLALLSAGNIRVEGDGYLGSFFQGLIYTRGNFHAEQVTLIGSLVVDSSPSQTVELINTRIFHKPETIQVNVPPPSTDMYFWMPDYRFDARIDMDSSPPMLVVESPFDNPAVGNQSFSNDALHTHTGPFGVLPLPANLQVDEATLLAFLESMVLLNSPTLPQNLLDQYANQHKDIVQDLVGTIDVSNPGDPDQFTVRPSEFLKPNEGSRLRLWRES